MIKGSYTPIKRINKVNEKMKERIIETVDEAWNTSEVHYLEGRIDALPDILKGE